MEYKDYYKILDVSKDADDKTIKRAYRQLARKYHPDKNPGDKKAEETFKEINEAYEVLGDSANRAKYDRLGRNYHRYQQMGGNGADFDFSQWFSGAGGGAQGRVHVDIGDLFGGGFSDFFNAVFGGGASRGATMGQDSMFNQMRGQGPDLDVQQTIDITLEEAYQGTTRRIQQNGSQFTTKIPPGSKTGTKVRLRGKGHSGPNGQGDLYLVVNVKPHDMFERAGNNLKVEVPVEVVTAVLGGKVEVPTMDGSVQLTIPSGTQGGQLFRLKGKGMPFLRDGKKYGDLMARVRISIPKDISPDQRHLYQQLADTV